MSIFKRLTNLVKANVNSLIDEAQDPQKMIDQAILDMKESLSKAKQMKLDILAALKSAEFKIKPLKDKIVNIQKKIDEKVAGGDDQAAKNLIKDKKAYLDEISRFEQDIELNNKSLEQINNSLSQLQDKIEKTKSQRNKIIARFNQVKARKLSAEADMHEQKDYVNDASSFETFDRMAEKIEDSESQVQALNELDQDGKNKDVELQNLFNKEEANKELEQIKKRLEKQKTTSLQNSKYLKSIEDELNKLKKSN